MFKCRILARTAVEWQTPVFFTLKGKKIPCPLAISRGENDVTRIVFGCTISRQTLAGAVKGKNYAPAHARPARRRRPRVHLNNSSDRPPALRGFERNTDI
ncbi:hypothetical protein EVAR_37152_1 [Eumeta japonica]|uniref:Uncharacterized protein n=1 Tax=Eumeta variegata TaxID=151549 RepID=A0A4C1WLK0_EUMVA|nr:hypothetical protein EVAR_37152_1 [Eumeta japonica]